MRMVRFLLTVIGLITVDWLPAQTALDHLDDVSMTVLPTIRQLPVSAVHAVCQDEEGYMWYGTVDGLCRDDGYRVHVFRSDFHTPTTINNNSVLTIAESDGRYLWFSTFDGMYLFDRVQNDIRRLNNIHAQGTDLLGRTHDGHVWLQDGDILKEMKPDGTLCRQYPLRGHMLCLFEDAAHRVFVSYDGTGLFVRDPAANNFRLLSAHFYPNSMIPAEPDGYWACQWGRGIFRLRIAGKNIELGTSYVPADLHGGSDNTVYQVISDLKGRLWALSYKDIYAFAPDADGGLQQLSTKGVIPQGSKMLARMAKTRNGQIWVSAFDSYTFILSTQNDSPSYYPLDDLERQSLYTPVVTAFCKDSDGRLWLSQERENVYVNGQRVDLSHVHDIAVSGKKGSVWTVSEGRYVIQLKMGSGRDVQVATQLHIPNANTVMEDRNGRLWIGTRAGILRYDDGKGEPVRLTDKGYVSDFTETADGTVWCSIREDGGLLRIDDRDSCRFFSMNQDCLTLDVHADTIWIGTGEGRLLRSQNINRISVDINYSDYTLQSGMNGDMIERVRCDSHGHVWVLTNQHIHEFNPRNRATHVYATATDALPLRRIMPHSIYYDREAEQMMFGGIPGIVAYSTNCQLDSPAAHVKIHITDVRVGEHSIWLQPLRPHDADNITIGPDEQNLRIDFSTLDFTPNLRNGIRYAYQMEGIDRGWVYLPAGENSAIYSHLPKGTYKFTVKATDANGLWSNDVTTLTIVRQPAWWETWWAYTLYIIAVLLVAFVILRLYIQRSREKEERQMVENLLKAKQLQVQTMKQQVQENQKTLVADDAETDTPVTHELDDKFIQKAIQLIGQNLSNPDLNVIFLASELGMSRSTCQRRIKALTGQSPLDFIKSVKLKRAYDMLQQNKTATVSEVMNAIGYSDQKSFTQSFKQAFGITPSERKRKDNI